MSAVKRLSVTERKKEIMESAAQIICSKGFEKVTMEEVIAGTSLSKGGVYHYYHSVLEIFKDIMIEGIDYRNQVIKEQFSHYQTGEEGDFIAEQLFKKIIDDNPYMPLYVEFLISQKRNPELKSIMFDLQEQSRKKYAKMIESSSEWLENDDLFQFMSTFINSLIIASDVLEARELFKQNRKTIERMFLLILQQGNQKISEKSR